MNASCCMVLICFTRGRSRMIGRCSSKCKGYFAQAGSPFGMRGGKITGAEMRIPCNGSKLDLGTRMRSHPKTANHGVCQMGLKKGLLQSAGWLLFYRNVAIKELK